MYVNYKGPCVRTTVGFWSLLTALLASGVFCRRVSGLGLGFRVGGFGLRVWGNPILGGSWYLLTIFTVLISVPITI